MAASSMSSQGIVATLGKRVAKRIWTTSANSAPATAAFRRAGHSSVYDKNLDDQVRPAVVPDDLIQPESDKYWAPHPQTGVFGPASENSSVANKEGGLGTSPANGGENSSLEEKAWFRPTSLEDFEKPHHI